MDWSTLKDAAIERLELSWGSGNTVFAVRYGVGEGRRLASLICEGTTRVECPKAFAPGPSAWVNEIREIPTESGSRLEIEMQSGVVVAVTAQAFRFEG